MYRRLLLEEEVGSTSSSCSDKPVAESDEAQNTTSASSQHSNTPKVIMSFRSKILSASQTPKSFKKSVRLFIQDTKISLDLVGS